SDFRVGLPLADAIGIVPEHAAFQLGNDAAKQRDGSRCLPVAAISNGREPQLRGFFPPLPRLRPSCMTDQRGGRSEQGGGGIIGWTTRRFGRVPDPAHPFGPKYRERKGWRRASIETHYRQIHFGRVGNDPLKLALIGLFSGYLSS